MADRMTTPDDLDRAIEWEKRVKEKYGSSLILDTLTQARDCILRLTEDLGQMQTLCHQYLKAGDRDRERAERAEAELATVEAENDRFSDDIITLKAESDAMRAVVEPARELLKWLDARTPPGYWFDQERNTLREALDALEGEKDGA